VLEMAEALKSDNLVVVGILRGSFMFIAFLVRYCHHRDLHPRLDFLTLESYGSATESSGNVQVAKDVHVNLDGADVLLIDDILDSGRTLNFAKKHVLNKGARSVRSCALLDKPSRRVIPFEAEHIGFTIEDVFVVGYGLDYDSYYRELPHIAKVTFT